MSRISYISLGLILFGLMNAASADDRPAGFVKICGNQESCTLPTTANVAFGGNNRFRYRILSGTFVCNAETFGSNMQADGTGVCSIPSRLLMAPRRPSVSNYGSQWESASDASS